jgi:hypothetical protein
MQLTRQGFFPPQLPSLRRRNESAASFLVIRGLYVISWAGWLTRDLEANIA